MLSGMSDGGFESRRRKDHLQLEALGSTQVPAEPQTAGGMHTLWLPHCWPSALETGQIEAGVPPVTGQRPTVHCCQTD